MAEVIQNNMVQTFVAVVEFDGSFKHYDFLCDIPVMHGDTVVVDTANGLQVAKVVGVKRESRAAHKWVVDNVNMAAYDFRRQKEKQKEALKRKMEARAKKLNELAKYKLLAQEDPEMAKLLTAYSALASEDENTLVWLPETTEGK